MPTPKAQDVVAEHQSQLNVGHQHKHTARSWVKGSSRPVQHETAEKKSLRNGRGQTAAGHGSQGDGLQADLLTFEEFLICLVPCTKKWKFSIKNVTYRKRLRS